MNDSKHTLGPWRFYTSPQPNGCPIVGNDRGLMVCMLAHSVHEKGQKEEALANARLIAAAPELLEVVEEIVKRYFVDRGFHDVSHEDLALEARAAIAKAKGEAS